MEVLCLPRQGGKTTQLLDWVWDNKEKRPLVVCMNEQEATRLWDQFFSTYIKDDQALVNQQWRGYWRDWFVSFDKYTKHRHAWDRTNDRPVVFDNIDIMFQSVFGSPTVVTLSAPIGL